MLTSQYSQLRRLRLLRVKLHRSTNRINMQNSNKQKLEAFLKCNGVCDEKKIEEIVTGFNLAKPVYEQLIEPGDKIFQYIRNVDASRPFHQTGNWFCFRGSNMDSLEPIPES